MTSPGLSNDQIQQLFLYTKLVCVLSSIGALFVLFCFWRFVALRKFAFKLVALLSFADLCVSCDGSWERVWCWRAVCGVTNAVVRHCVEPVVVVVLCDAIVIVDKSR